MDKWNYTFKPCGVIAHATVTVLVLHMNFVIKAIDDRFFSLYRKLLPRVIQRELQLLCQSFEKTEEVLRRLTSRPGSDGAFINGDGVIRNDQLFIDF